MRVLSLIVTATLVLVGCKPLETKTTKITKTDYDEIQTGNRCDDLVAKFGEPTSKTEASVDLGVGQAGKLQAQDLAWHLGDGSVMVVMCHDGKVVAKGWTGPK